MAKVRKHSEESETPDTTPVPPTLSPMDEAHKNAVRWLEGISKEERTTLAVHVANETKADVATLTLDDIYEKVKADLGREPTTSDLITWSNPLWNRI